MHFEIDLKILEIYYTLKKIWSHPETVPMKSKQISHKYSKSDEQSSMNIIYPSNTCQRYLLFLCFRWSYSFWGHRGSS